MSVVTSVRFKTVFAVVSVLVVIFGTLFGANVASADSVQVQSYERASQATEARRSRVKRRGRHRGVLMLCGIRRRSSGRTAVKAAGRAREVLLGLGRLYRPVVAVR